MSADHPAPQDAAGPGVGARRPYAPVRHPGRRDRWSPDSVIEALHAWRAETGSTPRRTHWTGQRPDLAGEAQRKWMREHPSWPSASSVARHHGSWSAALDRAGLVPRQRDFASPVAERVLGARALAADGAGRPDIAARLGVSVASVGNYLNARDCPDCGGPITNPRAERCGECTRHEPTRLREWTREQALDAVRDWTAEHGAPPTYREWTPSREAPGRWEARSPRWPSASMVCDLFADSREPWFAALQAAGTGALRRRWNDDAVRRALAAVWIRDGHAPTVGDLTAAGWLGPSPRTLRRRFGGVTEAWLALAPVPTDPEPRRATGRRGGPAAKGITVRR